MAAKLESPPEEMGQGAVLFWVIHMRPVPELLYRFWWTLSNLKISEIGLPNP